MNDDSQRNDDSENNEDESPDLFISEQTLTELQALADDIIEYMIDHFKSVLVNSLAQMLMTPPPKVGSGFMKAKERFVKEQ